MGLILQILSYIFFGAVFLFGMLTYFKDHKMYPLYPRERDWHDYSGHAANIFCYQISALINTLGIFCRCNVQSLAYHQNGWCQN